MARRRKTPRPATVPPAIEPGAYYSARDLRIVLPWVNWQMLAEAKKSGQLRFMAIRGKTGPKPAEQRGRWERHIYKGEWLLAWLATMEARPEEQAPEAA